MPSSFMPFMHAIFARAEDADAIPLDGKVIQVVAPQVDKKRDGGIGLDELHVYLNPEPREGMLSGGSTAEPGTEWGPPDQNQDQVMDVKLERTCTSIFHFQSSQIQNSLWFWLWLAFSSLPVEDRLPGFGRKGPPHMSNRMRTQELAHAIHVFGGFLDQPNHNGATRMQTLVSRWNRVYEQSSQSNPASRPKENVVTDNTIKESEKPVASAKDEASWIPFETTPELSPTPSGVSFAREDTTSTPAPSPVRSPPMTHSSSPSSSSSPSKPIPESHPVPHRSQPEPKTPTTNVTSSEPKMTKKQRMLNAARLAGSMTVEKPSSVGSGETHEAKSEPAGTVSETSGSEANPEPERDGMDLEEKNKAAAQKWWTFLTGGKG